MGDQTIHLVTAGQHISLPTVIIDGDLGLPAAVWDQLVKDLSQKTLVVTWDRPGYGWSPLGTQGHDGLTLVKALHQALSTPDNLGPYVQSSEIPGPYLLVGQGLGAAHMRLFATEYPTAVAGLVTLDAPYADTSTDALKARLADLSSEAMKRRLMLRRYNPIEPSWARYLDGAERDGAVAMALRTDEPKAEAAEISALDQTLQQAQGIQSFGNKPLRTLTTARPEDPTYASRLKQDQALAQLSTDGDQAVVPPFTPFVARNEIGQPNPLLAAILKALGAP
jgi:pimeloyl-ACP methyl ester carboxylesterase